MLQENEKQSGRRLGINPLQAGACRTYFNTLISSEATLVPPLDCTNCVIKGVNLETISGESPRDPKAPVTEARPPDPPDRTDSREPNVDPSPCFGAAFRNPSIPGTALDTWPNSSGLSRLLAKSKSAPVPPVAWS